MRREADCSRECGIAIDGVQQPFDGRISHLKVDHSGAGAADAEIRAALSTEIDRRRVDVGNAVVECQLHLDRPERRAVVLRVPHGQRSARSEVVEGPSRVESKVRRSGHRHFGQQRRCVCQGASKLHVQTRLVRPDRARHRHFVGAALPHLRVY